MIDLLADGSLQAHNANIHEYLTHLRRTLTKLLAIVDVCEVTPDGGRLLRNLSGGSQIAGFEALLEDTQTAAMACIVELVSFDSHGVGRPGRNHLALVGCLRGVVFSMFAGKKTIDGARVENLRRLSKALAVWVDESVDTTSDTGPATAAKPCHHNADFTEVVWYGWSYTFALGVQSAAVEALWNEWEKTGLGLHQDTIRRHVDPERDALRLDLVFRGHPAFRTMIQPAGDGKYRLSPPAKKKVSLPPE